MDDEKRRDPQRGIQVGEIGRTSDYYEIACRAEQNFVFAAASACTIPFFIKNLRRDAPEFFYGPLYEF